MAGNRVGALVIFGMNIVLPTMLTALEVNVMMNLSPLATAGLAWVMLGERLEWIQLVGMLVVIIGVALVQWHKREPSMEITAESPAPD